MIGRLEASGLAGSRVMSGAPFVLLVMLPTLAYDEAMPSRSLARGGSGRSVGHTARSDLVSVIPSVGTATRRPASRSSATARALSAAGPSPRRTAAKIAAVEPSSR